MVSDCAAIEVLFRRVLYASELAVGIEGSETAR